MGETGKGREGCAISRYSQIEDCTLTIENFVHCLLDIVYSIMIIVSNQMRGIPRK